MNQTPPVTGGAAGAWAYGLQSDRIASQAALRAADAQRDATDSRIAAQQKLYAVLGIGGGGGGGLLGDAGSRGPEVDWIRNEITAGRGVQNGLVDQMGAAQTNQIERDYSNAQGTALSRLDARGLGSSSLAGNALASVAESKNQSTLNLNEQLLGQKLGVEQQTRSAMTGAMESQLLRNQEDKALKSQYAGLIGSVWS